MRYWQPYAPIVLWRGTLTCGSGSTVQDPAIRPYDTKGLFGCARKYGKTLTANYGVK